MKLILFPVATFLTLLVGISSPLAAQDIDRRIPDEYESTGGHSLGLDNAGVAALGGSSSVRVNPGLLPLEPQYSMAFGYHWPTIGREFYQGSIVDSVTSQVAMGVTLTGFNESYDDYQRRNERDAETERRLSVGIARVFQRISFGLGGQWVSGKQDIEGRQETVRGATLGFGFAGLLTEKLRFGGSAENLANEKVKNFAPRIYRVGLAYMLFGGNLTTHLDYRQRERIASIEGDFPDDLTIGDNEGFEEDEKMVIGSFSARVYDVLRLLGAYGQSLSEDKRQTLSGGIGLVHNVFSLTYNVSRPYLSEKATHNSVNLNLMITM